MTKNRNLYSSIIKFIGDKELLGATYVELLKHGLDLTYFTQKEYEMLVINGQFKPTDQQPVRDKWLNFDFLCNEISRQVGQNTGVKYVLKAEFFIYLRELEELEFATKTAKEAKIFSTFAIGISILSVILATIQYFSSVNINSEQIDQIKTEIRNSK